MRNILSKNHETNNRKYISTFKTFVIRRRNISLIILSTQLYLNPIRC